MIEQPKATPYERAVSLSRAGMPAEEIVKTLIAEGVDADSARMLVSSITGAAPPRPARVREELGALSLEASQSPPSSPEQLARSAAMGQIGIGAIMLLVGGGITVATYASASSPSGGTYLVMWGPIVFGALRIFKGLGMLGGGGS